jgi:hypothetical protein
MNHQASQTAQNALTLDVKTQKCAEPNVPCPYFPLVHHPAPQAMFPPTPLRNDNLALLEVVRS